jgi:hypothetical protein
VYSENSANDFSFTEEIQRSENVTFANISKEILAVTDPIEKDLYEDCIMKMEMELSTQQFQFDSKRHNGLAIFDRFKNVKNVLITHSHSDHFHPESLKRLARENGGITVYIDKSCVNLVDDENINVIGISTGDVLEIEGHKVYVLPSNHFVSFSETTHHFVIDTPFGKTLFYGLDSAWLMTYETEFLIKHPADFFVLDCTLGRIVGDKRIFEHNSVYMLEYIVESLRNHGMIKKDGVIYADHLAKTLHPKHDEVVKDLDTFGVKVAYDGLLVEF